MENINEKKIKILVVGDDITPLIRDSLEKTGCFVISTGNVTEAGYIFKEERIDLILINITVSQESGYMMIAEIRKNKSDIPVIILSDRKDDNDIVAGLELGADYYLTKPCSPSVITAYVRAALRRYDEYSAAGEKNRTEMISCRELTLNLSTFQLFKNDKEIVLTPLQLKLLYFLMKNPDHVYTKKQIIEYLHGKQIEGDENGIMVHISNLREKIEDDKKNPKYLITVKGLGYKFSSE